MMERIIVELVYLETSFLTVFTHLILKMCIIQIFTGSWNCGNCYQVLFQYSSMKYETGIYNFSIVHPRKMVQLWNPVSSHDFGSEHVEKPDILFSI